MTLVLPNPNSPQNGQPLDANVIYQNQTAITQAIQSFDATQIAAGTLSNNAAFSTALSPQTRAKESSSDFIVKGTGIWSVVSGLTGTMSALTAYIQGIRVLANGIGSKVFPASQDTYVDVDYNGNIYYISVANGATTGMTLTANSVRVAKIVSSATALTIYQYGLDPLGNKVWAQGSISASNNNLGYSGARVALTNQSIPAAAFTTIVFGAKDHDTNNFISGNTFVAPYSGFYDSNISLGFTGYTSGARLLVNIITPNYNNELYDANISGTTDPTVTLPYNGIFLVGGQPVYWQAYVSSAASLQVYSSATISYRGF